jgi:hypothetical protein
MGVGKGPMGGVRCKVKYRRPLILVLVGVAFHVAMPLWSALRTYVNASRHVRSVPNRRHSERYHAERWRNVASTLPGSLTDCPAHARCRISRSLRARVRAALGWRWQ